MSFSFDDFCKTLDRSRLRPCPNPRARRPRCQNSRLSWLDGDDDAVASAVALAASVVVLVVAAVVVAAAVVLYGGP